VTCSPRQLNFLYETSIVYRPCSRETIQRDIDNIIVDVKIMSCSEPTDSFMVNVTVAQQPGHVPWLPPLAPSLFSGVGDGTLFHSRHCAER